MFRAILFQVVATAVTASGSALIVGSHGAISAVMGGMICLLPNLLFALRLKTVANRPGASYPGNFFLGEVVKIAATILLLYLVAKFFSDLHWPSLLIGMGLALQAVFLAFLNKN